MKSLASQPITHSTDVPLYPVQNHKRYRPHSFKISSLLDETNSKESILETIDQDSAIDLPKLITTNHFDSSHPGSQINGSNSSIPPLPHPVLSSTHSSHGSLHSFSSGSLSSKSNLELDQSPNQGIEKVRDSMGSKIDQDGLHLQRKKFPLNQYRNLSPINHAFRDLYKTDLTARTPARFESTRNSLGRSIPRNASDHSTETMTNPERQDNLEQSYSECVQLPPIRLPPSAQHPRFPSASNQSTSNPCFPKYESWSSLLSSHPDSVNTYAQDRSYPLSLISGPSSSQNSDLIPTRGKHQNHFPKSNPFNSSHRLTRSNPEPCGQYREHLKDTSISSLQNTFIMAPRSTNDLPSVVYPDVKETRTFSSPRAQREYSTYPSGEAMWKDSYPHKSKAAVSIPSFKPSYNYHSISSHESMDSYEISPNEINFPPPSKNAKSKKVPSEPDHLLNSSQDLSSSDSVLLNNRKRKYRRHPLPDPNEPVKPSSAYVTFANMVRQELRHQVNLSFAKLAKIVGQRWKALSALDKKKREEDAALAKKEYHLALTKYKLTPEYRNYQKYLAEFEASATLSGRPFVRKRRFPNLNISFKDA